MRKTIAKNPIAYHNYFINETFEAGIVLSGTEVKSIRNGRVNIKDSHASIQNGELWIHNMHVSPYEEGNVFNKNPIRDRKLLMHKKEIFKLLGFVKQDGMSLIPISIYFNNQNVKVELGVAKGKKLYDKRDEIAKKDAERYIQQHIKY